MSNTYFLAIGGHWGSGNSLSLMYKAIADELVHRGQNVIILVPALRPEQVIDSGNPKVLTWPSKRPTKWVDALFLIKLIKQYHPDCFIANFASVNWMMLLGWFYRVNKRITWYHTVIDATENQTLLDKLKIFRKSLIYKLTTQIVAVSDFAKSRDLLQNYRVSSEKITVFYNLVGDPFSLGILPSPKKYVLTYSGRLEQWKGLDVLIKAMPKVLDRFPETELRIMGSGSKQKEYEKLCENLDVENALCFLGNVVPHQVYKELSKSYLHIHPARTDNCPLSIIEAISMGVPVVASSVGGIPEIIRDGIDGFLVPPDDPEALAEKIIQVFETFSFREELSQQARERFLSLFELSRGVPKIVDWLEQ